MCLDRLFWLLVWVCWLFYLACKLNQIFKIRKITMTDHPFQFQMDKLRKWCQSYFLSAYCCFRTNIIVHLWILTNFIQNVHNPGPKTHRNMNFYNNKEKPGITENNVQNPKVIVVIGYIFSFVNNSYIHPLTKYYC